MSIEQTKLFKDSIETPILRTNEVKAQQIQGDVIMQGYSLHDILFTDEDSHRKIDVSELIEQKNIRYAAEQIYSFYMGTTDYRGKAIEAVHLRRDGNVGNAISRTNEVYLYADCYDENGNLVDTIFSENKEMQDGSDMVTTWNFNPHIYIHDYYKQIKFYCSKVKGERQFQNQNTRVNIRSQSIRYRVQPQGKPNENPMPSEDWKTYDQANQKAFTTDFAFTINYRQLGFIKHMENFDIHLSEDKSNLLNLIPTISQELENHKNDWTVHVTEKQKESLRTLVLLQTSYNAHKNNKTIHITEDERNKWNQKFDERDIEEYLNVPTLQFSTLKEGFVSHDKGMGEAYYVQLSRQHFTTGKIQEIHIPYKAGKNKTSYLCAQIYNQGDDENTVKQLNDCIFSTNTQSQPQGTEGVSIFEFDNLILPQNYRFVRFIFTQNNTQLPDISSRANIIGMRIRVITQASNQQGWQAWDDDDCKILGSDNVEYNWYGYVQAVGIKHAYVVTNDEKEIITSVPSISTSLTSHITDTNIHFSKDLIIDGIIEVDEQFEERTWDFSQGASASGAQGIAYAQICNTHILPQGSLLKRIAVPQHSNPASSEYTANTPLYLVIWGDRNDNDIWEYVTHSSNTQQQIGGGDGMIFEFEGHVDIGAYKKYRFFYVLDEANVNQLPTTGSNFNGVKMAFPSRRIDDACKVMQTNGTWANRHTFPAIITYDVDLSTSTSYEILHKDNEDRHLTLQQKNDMIESMAALSDTITTLNGHIGNTDIHLSSSQITNIDKVETIENSLENHIGDSIHLTDVDKTKINKVDAIQVTVTQHIGDDSHLTDDQKTKIKKIVTIENDIDEIRGKIEDQIVEYSEQSEFEFISESSNYQDCQGIAYVQICGNHKLPQNSILTKIKVACPKVQPKDGQYTTDAIYLVIYGDSGNDNYQFIDCSINSQYQIPHGDDMIFEFEGLKDLGQYEKYRLFYVRNIQDANRFPQVTNNSVDYTDVKMAFRAYDVDLNCAIWQTNNNVLYNRSFPASFITVNKSSQIVNHIDNTQKHFTLKEKQFLHNSIQSINDKLIEIDRHTSNHDIHLDEDQIRNLNRFESLKTTVDGHIGDASHLTDNQKTEINKISTISSQITGHTGSTDVHVTVDDKNRWNSIETIDNETKNNISQLISALLMPKTSNFTTVRDGYVTPNAGKATITCAQLSKKHFTTGRIKSIEFPYFGGTGTEGYLCVQFIGIEEDIDTVEKTFEDCYYSNEKMTQSGDGTAVFTFDNLVTPIDYKVVRFMIVADKNTVPNGRNGTNCLSWRARFMTPADNTGNYTTFDTDDCNVYNGSTFTNYVIYTKGVRVSTFVDEVTTDLILDMKNKIDELEQRISSLQNS